jgi:hypothetical protein
MVTSSLKIMDYKILGVKAAQRQIQESYKGRGLGFHNGLMKGASMNRNEGYYLPDLYLPLLREEAQGGSTPQHDLTSRP